MNAKSLSLVVAQRSDLKKPSTEEIRATGKIPGVVYGHGVDTRHISLNPQEFEKVYRDSGDSTLINLTVDKEEAVPVLVQDIQRDPRNRTLTHVDFHQVRMDEEITTDVKLHFVGVAPAEKSLGGILLKNLDTVEITCLPKDLIDEIEVDVSSLATFDDVIHVSDLKVPAAVTIANHAEDVVAMVQEPRKEAEPEPVAAEATEAGAEAAEGEEKKDDAEASEESK